MPFFFVYFSKIFHKKKLRQILKEEYPIVAKTSEELIEILKKLGLNIPDEFTLTEFGTLIDDFKKEADEKKKEFTFISSQKIAKAKVKHHFKFTHLFYFKHPLNLGSGN